MLPWIAVEVLECTDLHGLGPGPPPGRRALPRPSSTREDVGRL